MTNQFGDKIRKLREDQNILLRQIAYTLDMDTSLISKIERGERPLKKDLIPTLAKALNADINELTTLWLADQIMGIISNEPLGQKAMNNIIKKTK